MLTSEGIAEPIVLEPDQTEIRSLTVSVVLPCLNEAGSVGACVREALAAMALAGIDGEVLVVDNGSCDGSAEVADRAGARVIVEERPGYGSALKAGIAAAFGSIVVMADADSTYDLRQIPALLRPILDGQADLVLGSRLRSATMKSMPALHRYIGTPVLTYLVSRAAGKIPVSDSQSGFRAFRRDALIGLNLRGVGMEFASEMLIRAGERGLRILDVPTEYRQRIGESKLNALADGWRHLRLIILMAPHLVLVVPGLLLLITGLILSVLTLVSPTGLEIGSLRWQPIFFSTIAITLGLQSAVGGIVLAYHSSLMAKSIRQRFSFVGQPTFPGLCMRAGVAALALGFGIDGLLFALWVTGNRPPDPGSALAGLAQSALISGGFLATLGLALRSWYWNGRSNH